ncbi:MAG: hypothetical protein ACRD29_14580 [Acidimicrobiales bacterium]
MRVSVASWGLRVALATMLLAACTNGDDDDADPPAVDAPGRPDVAPGEVVVVLGGGDEPLPDRGEQAVATEVELPDPFPVSYAADPADGSVYFVNETQDSPRTLYRLTPDGLVEALDIDLRDVVIPEFADFGGQASRLAFGPDGLLY